eukprot:TRINITY_DN1827_c0_g1_i1.p1 TRINITY_DN1827_c0_g1~~TRINITY_DN1827_c0_g1_i1.p1  ORF type:complete len:165 (-),score=79.92 TRINITY_DN1827_c0_g1_i1:218-712(-)
MCSEEAFEQLAEMAAASGVERGQLATAFSGVHLMLRMAVRQRLKHEAVQRDLLDTLKLPAFLVADFVKALKASALAERKLAEQRVRSATLEQLNWRCDVTVSSNQIGRVLKPSVVLEVRVSDGRRRTFELTTAQFAALRYQVARCLADMHELERLAILKIAPGK